MSLALMAKDCPSLAELEKRYIEVVLVKTGGRKEREFGWVTDEPGDLSAEDETQET